MVPYIRGSINSEFIQELFGMNLKDNRAGAPILLLPTVIAGAQKLQGLGFVW